MTGQGGRSEIHLQDHLHSTEKRIADELASAQRHLLVGHGDGMLMAWISINRPSAADLMKLLDLLLSSWFVNIKIV
jgi:hypothetical protein